MKQSVSAAFLREETGESDGELCFADKDMGEKAVGAIGSSVAADNMATDAGIDSYQKHTARGIENVVSGQSGEIRGEC